MDPSLIFPVGDEIAPVSAARQSAGVAINAFILRRSFGCGCAALSMFSALRTYQHQL
jgi:hypothetical protein